MFLSTMAWISFGGTGWFALALLASEISSLLQPASARPAASAAEVTSSRTGRREIKPEAPHPPGNVGNPNIRFIALKPLIKILPVVPLRRNPNGAVPRVSKQPWSTELKQAPRGLIAAEKRDFRQGVAVIPQRWLLLASAELAADFQKLLPALLADAAGVEIVQLGEGLRDGLAGAGDHG
jgi:hypothetical protein